MVTHYIKVSISIKRKDEREFNNFLRIAKEDPNFKIKKDRGTKGSPKMMVEFEGVSGVFNKFWKFYLKKNIENKDGN